MQKTPIITMEGYIVDMSELSVSDIADDMFEVIYMPSYNPCVYDEDKELLKVQWTTV